MITAIIQSYVRQKNIPIIIDALRKQSVKPSRIIVWNDNDGRGSDLKNLGNDVEIINTNSNYNGNYGSFLIAYLADTKYIAIIDDDYPPGKDWFKFCVENQKNRPGVYGKFGVIIENNSYKSRKVKYSTVDEKNLFTEVDMVGQSYFFPKEAILPMFSVRPPFWHNNVDLHFSFLARKHGWKLYVPTVQNKDQSPHDDRIYLYLNHYDNAMFLRGNHLEKRDEYVKWASKNL